MKKITHRTLLISAIATCGAITSAPALAEVELSANVALTSDYVWRGMSQNDGNPAIQGGFDLEHASGFYAGTWASNVDAGDSSIELDFYAGLAGGLDSGLGYDLGIIRYTYPGDSDLDFTEFYAGVSYDFGAVEPAFMVSYDPDNKDRYCQLSAGFALPSDFSLDLHVGRYTWKDDANVNDYGIVLGTEVGGFDLSLGYTNTNMSNKKDAKADGRVALTIARSF